MISHLSCLLREICVRLNSIDYLAFLSEANEHGQTPQELLYEIINYYIIINKKRLAVNFKTLKKLD